VGEAATHSRKIMASRGLQSLKSLWHISSAML
jgi:hypothetical protein